MSAVFFDMNLSRPELEREVDRMMRDFDRIRKRVTGRHQVRENLPSVVTLPRESFLQQGLFERLFLDGPLPDTSSSSPDSAVPASPVSRPTLEMVSGQVEPPGFTDRLPANEQATQFFPSTAPSSTAGPERTPWKTDDASLRGFLVGSSSGLTGKPLPKETVKEETVAPVGPPTMVFPAPPSLRLDTLDIASLTAETLGEWVRQIQSGIVQGDLSAILEAVYWASPQSSTPHATRHELVRSLYTAAMDTVEVCHLALRLALEANEPFEPIRRLSLDFLIRCFRVFGIYQSQVLETLRLAADPQSESRETVRLIAVRFLCQIMGNHPPVRQWLYQVLWLRREPSLMCRMILLENILLWIQERDASERERFEGLYLLQRTLEDERESFHVRFSIASQMLDSRFTVFPPDVLSYLHQKIFPLCRQIVRDASAGKVDAPSVGLPTEGNMLS